MFFSVVSVLGQEIFSAKCSSARDMVLEQSSAECEQVCEAFVKCRDLCLQAPSAEFLSAKGADGVASRDIIAELELGEVFKRVAEFASVDEIEILRSQYQQRFISTVVLGCKLATMGADIPASFGLHAEFRATVTAMEEFLKSSVKDRFHVMENGRYFKASIEDGQSLLTWAGNLTSTIRGAYAATLRGLAEEMVRKTPPEESIANAKMLSDKTLQNSLFQNPHRDELNPLTQKIQDAGVEMSAAACSGEWSESSDMDHIGPQTTTRAMAHGRRLWPLAMFSAAGQAL